MDAMTDVHLHHGALSVSNLARSRVVHDGPFEHTSSLKLIESTFGMQPLTARDANARNLADVLETGAILTLDSDVAVYRWRRRRSFELLVQR